MAQNMNPNDPRYGQMLDSLNSEFSKRFPQDAARLQHAPDIENSILSRNPSLKGLYQPQQSGQAPQLGAVAQAPGMGAPGAAAPMPAQPQAQPQGQPQYNINTQMPEQP